MDLSDFPKPKSDLTLGHFIVVEWTRMNRDSCVAIKKCLVPPAFFFRSASGAKPYTHPCQTGSVWKECPLESTAYCPPGPNAKWTHKYLEIKLLLVYPYVLYFTSCSSIFLSLFWSLRFTFVLKFFFLSLFFLPFRRHVFLYLFSFFFYSFLAYQCFPLLNAHTSSASSSPPAPPPFTNLSPHP